MIPIEDDPACNLWDLVGSTVQGNPLTFEAETFVTEVRGEDCEPVDFGQAMVPFKILAKPQRVRSVNSPDLVAIRAQINVSRNNSADGVIQLCFRDGTVDSYCVVFGAAFYDPLRDRAHFQLFGFQRGTGYLMQATVSSDGQSNPDCLIWDVVNGVTGEVQHTFEAATSIRLFRGN